MSDEFGTRAWVPFSFLTGPDNHVLVLLNQPVHNTELLIRYEEMCVHCTGVISRYTVPLSEFLQACKYWDNPNFCRNLNFNRFLHLNVYSIHTYLPYYINCTGCGTLQYTGCLYINCTGCGTLLYTG